MKSLRDPDVLGLSKVRNPSCIARWLAAPGVLCEGLTRSRRGWGSAPRQKVLRGQRDAAGGLSHLRLPCPYRSSWVPPLRTLTSSLHPHRPLGAQPRAGSKLRGAGKVRSRRAKAARGKEIPTFGRWGN